mmetsp:Transcript_12602/g.24887  ORF Transcript_12602/g.24887 Transcript_12602/m.24887 type:complete len:288 (+) Transcript_12602:126-989(+)
MATRGSSSAEAESNYIEDYIETLGSLPNEIRRYFELMRELDSEGSGIINELNESEQTLIAGLKEKRGGRAGAKDESVNAALVDIRAKRRKAQHMADEKVSVADQACAECDIHLDRLDTELARFEEHLRTSGDFAAAGAVLGEQVAARPADEWILGRVKEYTIQTGVYVIMDEDDDKHSYEVSENLVVVLEGDRVSKGEPVFAVYPDTTSFYQGVITSVPRKGANALGGGGAGAGSGRGNDGSMTCTVQFVDDVDETTGVTPDRVVPLRHIFRRELAAKGAAAKEEEL